MINSNAQVGRNCRLHPGVTIGDSKGFAPVIGDEVFIGPGAGVYGNVSIGDRVHIAPGATVWTDVPDDTIVLPASPTFRVRDGDTVQAVLRRRVRPNG